MLRSLLLLVSVVPAFAVNSGPTEWNNGGVARYQAGDMAEAETLFLRALDAWKQAGQHCSQARTMGNLAVLYRAQGRYREAEAMNHETLRLLENSHNGQSPESVAALINLAELYRVQRQAARAEPYSRRALSIGERIFGAGNRATADALQSLASIVNDRGRSREALDLYSRAGALLEKKPGEPPDPRLMWNLGKMAEIYLVMGTFPEAEAAARRALALSAHTLDPHDPLRAESFHYLAQVLRVERRFDQAEPLYLEALTLMERDAAGSGRVLAHLAGCYHDQERESRAAETYTRALALLDASLGLEDPETALVRTQLADVLRAQRRYAQSLEIYRRALPLIEHAYGRKDPRVAAALRDMRNTESESKRYFASYGKTLP